jgi:hypothetical protein
MRPRMMRGMTNPKPPYQKSNVDIVLCNYMLEVRESFDDWPATRPRPFKKPYFIIV